MLNTSTASTYLCRLATNAESTDQSAVALDIAALHVIEQTATLADELHESAARVMIAFMNLEVLGEMRNPVGQNRDLNFGRAGVRGVSLIVLDDLLLLSHNVFLPYESGVPLRTAYLTTHVISVADRVLS